MVCSCSSPVREAQQVVAQADSLRVNHSVTYDDSLAMADAYAVLGKWRLIYPDDYARACYYYGRLLRNRGYQVAALQAFISGTHAPYVQRVVPLLWFSDYHILGRIYSNLGTMCHLAGEFELSYNMYEISAEHFLRSHDTISYYYSINNEAFELATGKQYDDALYLLNMITDKCSNQDVITLTWETKAQLYFKLEQYDSVIYAANQLQDRDYSGAIGYLKKAQSYWHLKQKDSASYYAKLVLEHPYADAADKYNVLYILTYGDTANTTEVQKRSEERQDIDKEILDPLHEQLAQAITYLQYDINKRPHYINLGLLIISLCVIGGITWAKKVQIKHHQLKIQQETIAEQAKQQYLAQENAKIESDLKQLQASADIIRRQNIDLQTNHSVHRDEILEEIEATCTILRNSQDWKNDLHWRDYDAFCKTVDDYFLKLASKLKTI